MNILIVSHGIPSQEDPQWGCFELDQARALKALGHRVTIAAVDGRFRKRRKTGITHLLIERIDAYLVYWLPLKLLCFRRIKHWVRNTMTLSLFDSIIKDSGIPDVIYAHYMFGMFELTKVRRKYPSVPIVGIEHWSVLNKSTLSKNLIDQGNVAYSTVDRLLAVSESLKTQIKKHFNKDSEVVNDMLGEEFVGAKVENKQKEASFRFIAVGSLYTIKRFDLLIRAFAQSELAKANCSVTIVGDGEERQRLKSLIEELKLTDCVFLVGRKNKQEIIGLLQESNAFVLSSEAETFGVACIEALSQGLPAIATRCGGPEEFITKSNGILIEPNNVVALANAMKEIYKDYEQYDFVSIAEECNRRFAPQNIAKRLEKIFEEEIEKKKKIV